MHVCGTGRCVLRHAQGLTSTFCQVRMQGEDPYPNCTGEEMALHMMLKRAEVRAFMCPNHPCWHSLQSSCLFSLTQT